MARIEKITARQIIDSRGHPTVEVDVELSDGALGRAAVPSGASTGQHEAIELRDGNQEFFRGRGVQKAIHNIHEKIGPKLLGMNAQNQFLVDETLCTLDGTDNKSVLGANATLGVSMAVARAQANSARIPLFRYLGGFLAKAMPLPMFNFINGGQHAHNGLDIQEFMVMPLATTSFGDGLQVASEIYMYLKELLHKKGLATSLGDEGGFAPDIRSTRQALDFLCEAVQASGYTLGEDVEFAMDVAATEFFDGRIYTLEGKRFSPTELADYYVKLIKDYPITSIEDGMAEDDWSGWKVLTDKLGDSTLLVGDDLFVTNTQRLEQGIQKEVANAILIKPNQIGTLSETVFTVQLAQKAGYETIMSHRSGETEDTLIADLAVALNCDRIKTGSIARSERVAKYNQLLRIEEQLFYAS